MVCRICPNSVTKCRDCAKISFPNKSSCPGGHPLSWQQISEGSNQKNHHHDNDEEEEENDYDSDDKKKNKKGNKKGSTKGNTKGNTGQAGTDLFCYECGKEIQKAEGSLHCQTCKIDKCVTCGNFKIK